MIWPGLPSPGKKEIQPFTGKGYKIGEVRPISWQRSANTQGAGTGHACLEAHSSWFSYRLHSQNQACVVGMEAVSSPVHTG